VTCGITERMKDIEKVRAQLEGLARKAEGKRLRAWGFWVCNLWPRRADRARTHSRRRVRLPVIKNATTLPTTATDEPVIR